MKLKKGIIPYLLYSLIIIIFELYIFYNYDHFNINLISFSISFFIIGFIIIKEYQKYNSLFSLRIIFNLFGLLYTNFYIVQMMMAESCMLTNRWWIYITAMTENSSRSLPEEYLMV